MFRRKTDPKCGNLRDIYNTYTYTTTHCTRKWGFTSDMKLEPCNCEPGALPLLSTICAKRKLTF